MTSRPASSSSTFNTRWTKKLDLAQVLAPTPFKQFKTMISIACVHRSRQDKTKPSSWS